MKSFVPEFIVNALKNPERISAFLALCMLSYNIGDFYDRLQGLTEVVLFSLTLFLVYVMLLRIVWGKVSIVGGLKRRRS